MASSVKTHQAVLRVLQSAKPNLRKAILAASDKSIIFAICEICDNLLLGNIPLSEDQKKKLRAYRKVLRQLAQRGEGWKTKKNHLVQHGGSFLPLLLSVVASVLPQLFNGAR